MSGSTMRRRRARSPVVTAASLVALWACGGGPVAPGDELSETMTSAHFAYAWSAGDIAPDTVYQERHLAWVRAGLGLEPGARIEYLKYRDVAHLRRVTGHDMGTGFAEPERYRFHTISVLDNHEYVHVLVMAEVGEPPALFNEGVAVAHHGASISGAFDGDPLWNGTGARGQVRAYRNAGTLPDLDALLESEAFRRVDANVAYAVAGSFVRYLIDEAGAAALLAFVERCPSNASAATVRARFREVYDEDLDTWWARWIAWL